MDEYQRIIRLLVDAAQADKELKELRGELEKTNSMLRSLGAAFRNLRKLFFTGLAIVGVVRTLSSLISTIVRAREEIELLEASFTILTGSAERGAKAVEQVFETVQRTGGSFDAVVDGFRQIQIGLSGFDASNEQIQAVVESFIQLGRIAGASTQNINAALYQLSQGLASNRLQGDELRSIMERMPIFAKLLADEMGIATGQLREAAAAGRTTADVVANALIRNFQRLNEEAKTLPVRLGEAGNKVGAAWTQFLATLNESSRTTETIITTFEFFQRMLEDAESTVAVMNATWTGTVYVLRVITAIVVSLIVLFENLAITIRLAVRSFNIGDQRAAWADFKRDLKEANDRGNEIVASLLGVGEAVRDSMDPEPVNELTAAMKELGLTTDVTTEWFITMSEKMNEAADEAKLLSMIVDNTGYFFEAFLGRFQSKSTSFEGFLFAVRELAELNIDTVFEKLKWAADEGFLSAEEFAKAWEVAKETIKETKDEAEEAAKTYYGFAQATSFATRAANALVDALTGGTTPGLRANNIVREAEEAAAEARLQAEALTLAHRQFQDQLLEGKITLQEYFDLLKAAGIDLPKFTSDVKGANSELSEQQKIAEGLANVIRGNLSGSFDELVDSIGKAKVSFEDFAIAFIQDITKMIARITIFEKIASLISQKFGAGKVSTGGGGGGGGSRSSAASAVGFLGATRMAGAGFAGGGVTAPMVVNIQNNASVDVEARQSDVGGARVLDVVIRDRIRAAVSDGSLDRVLGSTYGLRRKGRL